MKYDVDYFIDKFSKIPDDKWSVGKFIDEKGRKCALGHCGVNSLGGYTKQSLHLESLFTWYLPKQLVVEINDGNNSKFKQKTPKARMLSALRHIKRKVKK